MLKKLWSDETGAGMVEYVLLIALVAGLVFAVVKAFGQELNTIFESAAKLITSGNDEFTD